MEWEDGAPGAGAGKAHRGLERSPRLSGGRAPAAPASSPGTEAAIIGSTEGKASREQTECALEDTCQVWDRTCSRADVSSPEIPRFCDSKTGRQPHTWGSGFPTAALRRNAAPWARSHHLVPQAQTDSCRRASPEHTRPIHPHTLAWVGLDRSLENPRPMLSAPARGLPTPSKNLCVRTGHDSQRGARVTGHDPAQHLRAQQGGVPPTGTTAFYCIHRPPCNPSTHRGGGAR